MKKLILTLCLVLSFLITFSQFPNTALLKINDTLWVSVTITDYIRVDSIFIRDSTIKQLIEKYTLGYTFGEGLTELGGDVSWGGPLTGSVYIDAAQNDIQWESSEPSTGTYAYYQWYSNYIEHLTKYISGGIDQYSTYQGMISQASGASTYIITEDQTNGYSSKIEVDEDWLQFHRDGSNGGVTIYLDDNGLKFNSDYSTYWSTDRYIPDIGWINKAIHDSLGTINIISYTFGNGLTESGGAVSLGGSAIDDIFIYSDNNNYFDVMMRQTGTSSNRTELYMDYSSAYLAATANSYNNNASVGVSDGSGITFDRKWNSVTHSAIYDTSGFEYIGDFSSIWDGLDNSDRIIPDLAYITNAIHDSILALISEGGGGTSYTAGLGISLDGDSITLGNEEASGADYRTIDLKNQRLYFIEDYNTWNNEVSIQLKVDAPLVYIQLDDPGSSIWSEFEISGQEIKGYVTTGSANSGGQYYITDDRIMLKLDNDGDVGYSQIYMDNDVGDQKIRSLITSATGYTDIYQTDSNYSISIGGAKILEITGDTIYTNKYLKSIGGSNLGGSNYTFGNGLTESGGAVSLGGSAIDDIFIYSDNNNYFDVMMRQTGTSSNRTELYMDYSSAYLAATANSYNNNASVGVSDGSGITFDRKWNSVTHSAIYDTSGFEYIGDFSSIWNGLDNSDRIIPDLAYITNAIHDSILGLGGSLGTDGQVPYMNLAGTDHLFTNNFRYFQETASLGIYGSDPNIYISGAGADFSVTDPSNFELYVDAGDGAFRFYEDMQSEPSGLYDFNTVLLLSREDTIYDPEAAIEEFTFIKTYRCAMKAIYNFDEDNTGTIGGCGFLNSSTSRYTADTNATNNYGQISSSYIINGKDNEIYADTAYQEDGSPNQRSFMLNCTGSRLINPSYITLINTHGYSHPENEDTATVIGTDLKVLGSITFTDTAYKSFNPAGWIPNSPNSDDVIIAFNQVGVATGPVSFSMPINLPDGYTILEVIAYGSETDEQYVLRRVNLASSSVATVATANFNTADNTISSGTIDNENYTYALNSSSLDDTDLLFGVRIKLGK